MPRRPTELVAGLAGVDALLADLIHGAVQNLRLELAVHQRPDPVDELEHREARLGGEVEWLADELRALGHRRREPRRALGGILDVEVVADVSPVRADDGALRPEQRPDSTRNDSLPLEIAAAVHVP